MTKKFISENIKTLIYALIIAIFIRSIFIQPFYIPSSSMEPNLLVGDRLFVTKYSYGYSKHSFPFSPNLFIGRLFFNSPKRGDVVVFKTPTDNRTDYIKRLIGIPGDIIQFIDGDLFLNDNQILKTKKKVLIKSIVVIQTFKQIFLKKNYLMVSSIMLLIINKDPFKVLINLWYLKTIIFF